MVWAWELKDWPNFSFDNSVIESYEDQFLKNSGFLVGAYQYLNNRDQDEIFIDIISDEAISTSEIEGNYLNRGSVQLSLKKNFGLLSNLEHSVCGFNKQIRISPAEQ